MPKMNDIKKKIQKRTDYRYIYYVIAIALSLWFAMGTWGPFCIFFSWGSAILFSFLRLLRILSTSIVASHNLNDWQKLLFGLIFLILMCFFTIIYTVSLSLINTKLSKKFKWNIPYLTLAYYASGVLVAFLVMVPYEGEYWSITWSYYVYPVFAVIALLYIFLDWHLAKRIEFIKEKESPDCKEAILDKKRMI
jgi:hypothetical protein